MGFAKGSTHPTSCKVLAAALARMRRYRTHHPHRSCGWLRQAKAAESVIAVPAFYFPAAQRFRGRGCPRRESRISFEHVGWVERLVRRSSQSEGGSDTHQLKLAKMMGFATGSTHPTCCAIAPCGPASSRAQAKSSDPAATKQPDGQITKKLSSPSHKNIPLNPSGKSSLKLR